MSHQIRCGNCGAVSNPTTDGRTFACEYCGAKTQVAIDADQLAAGFKVDLANHGAFLSQLAHALHPNFRERSKLILEGQRVALFELNLDPDLFVARHEATGVVAMHKKLVRGVALKTVTHPLDRWVDLLTKALAAHANENARVAMVLGKLRGG